MSKPREDRLHWRSSCAVNACLGGSPREPLCSRAWRRGWVCFIDAMQLVWRDPIHCEEVHLYWRLIIETRNEVSR